MDPSFINHITPGESTVLDESADINIWGTPAKLTSFGYKWRDDKCSNAGDSENSSIHPKPKKKRAALCLYGGISPYTNPLVGHSQSSNISDLSNIDWAATLYDTNLLPEGDFELDLFIHSWSETYFCTIARSYDGTRFNVRSIIAEPNDRHMKELIPQIKDQNQTENGHNIPPRRQSRISGQLSMYFSMNKVLAQALDYSNNHCGFEYDLLIAARPDVLLAEPITLHNNKDGTETSLQLALNPHSNVVLHSHIVNAWKGEYIGFGDYHYIFNAANARTFVEKMFPSPDQKWPEIAKLRNQIVSHS